jgi:hypothetical protein
MRPSRHRPRHRPWRRAFKCRCSRRLSRKSATTAVCCRILQRPADVSASPTLIRRTAEAVGVTSASSLGISPTPSTYATASARSDSAATAPSTAPGRRSESAASGAPAVLAPLRCIESSGCCTSNISRRATGISVFTVEQRDALRERVLQLAGEDDRLVARAAVGSRAVDGGDRFWILLLASPTASRSQRFSVFGRPRSSMNSTRSTQPSPHPLWRS